MSLEKAQIWNLYKENRYKNNGDISVKRKGAKY